MTTNASTFSFRQVAADGNKTEMGVDDQTQGGGALSRNSAANKEEEKEEKNAVMDSQAQSYSPLKSGSPARPGFAPSSPSSPGVNVSLVCSQTEGAQHL